MSAPSREAMAEAPCCCAALRGRSKHDLLAALREIVRAGAVPPHDDAGRPSDVGGDDQLRQRRLGHRSHRLSLRRRSIREPASLAGDAAVVSRTGRRRRRRKRALPASRRMPASINRYEPGARHVAAPGQGRAGFWRADRLGVAGLARDLPVRRPEAQRQGRRATGWSTATSWSGAGRRGWSFTASRRSPTASTRCWAAAHQPDLPQGAVDARVIEICKRLEVWGDAVGLNGSMTRKDALLTMRVTASPDE